MTIHEALSRSADELQQQLEEHRRMLSLACKGGDGGEITLPFRSGGNSEYCKVKQTLAETIEVLEATRKSFKSKQLEQLRRRLVRVLAELN